MSKIMNYEIILATNNKHKLKEVREILSPHKIVVYGLSDLNIKLPEVEENGSTYAENALINTLSALMETVGLEANEPEKKPLF